MSDDRPINRRRFFRQGLGELLRPILDAVEPIQNIARQFGDLEEGPPPSRPHWLRPPGALVEDQFLKTCDHSGECVRVCPAQCIKIDPTKRKGDGVPFIEVDTMPCVVCDGLLCMHACPSGALVPTPLGEIDMGTAVWLEHLCSRTTGSDCTICIDRCPLGSTAIELLEGKVHVKEEGCIGCGVCQHDCPTDPKSIVVIPRSAR